MFLHYHWRHYHCRRRRLEGIVDLIFIHALVSNRKLLENEWLIAHFTLGEFQRSKREREEVEWEWEWEWDSHVLREFIAWLKAEEKKT